MGVWTECNEALLNPLGNNQRAVLSIWFYNQCFFVVSSSNAQQLEFLTNGGIGVVAL